jgi:2-amino-4-hydroxy-6-hydroxymethyldihydropteridine diphosphokinase
MNKSHLAYLSLGSNIQPEENLVRAVGLLQQYGQIETLSNVWESKSVGAEGPNYLNACISFVSSFSPAGLKENVISPIEQALGRKRTGNKFAPRTMDIDIVIFDNVSCDDKYWEQAFVVIPLAEIFPTFTNPLTQEPVHETAARLRHEIWMETRQGIFSQSGRGNTRA